MKTTQQYKEEIVCLDFLNLLEAEPYISRKLRSELVLKEEMKSMYMYIFQAYEDLAKYMNECEAEQVKKRVGIYLLKEKMEKELKNENKHSSNRRKV